MDVATIIANIRSQALVGNTGSADDTDRILRYLNKGYTKVYTRIAAVNPNFFEKLQQISIINGEGVFTSPVHTILSVTDRMNNNHILYPRAMSDVREFDPALTTTGSPVSYDRTLNGLVVYPLGTTTLDVWHCPTPPALTATTTEAEIQIPAAYHEVLEWAALWTLAYDERDKLVGTELQFTRAAYDEIMDSLIAFMQNLKPAQNRRVRAKW